LNILFKAAPELLDQYVRLLPPRVEEAEQIILAPFVDEELKQKFATRQNHVKELEGLAKSIATQIQQRSENGFINLTELQIVCRKLWESRDPARYFHSNDADIQKVLEGYWVDALKKLGDLYEPSIALLGHMITSTNTRNIVSEPDLKFFENDNFSEDQISRAMNALVDSKLVRREPRHRIYFYEIVSEFLVPWIREKKTARLAQIQAKKLAAQTRQRLEQVERERRYVSIFAVVLGVLLILSGYLSYKAYTAYKSEKKTREELVEAQKKKAEAEDLVKAISDLTNPDPQVRLAALNKLVELDRQAKLPRNLVPFIVAVIANDQYEQITYTGRYFYDSLKELNTIQSSDSEQSKISNFIVEAAEKNKVLAESQASRIAPRIYFQLANDNQRARADKIAGPLRVIGFTIPAYEIVGRRAPGDNQLRYYKPTDDSDLQFITGNRDKALQKIREIDGSSWSYKEFKPSPSVRPGHFEMWFAGDAAQGTTASPSPSPSQTSQSYVTLTFTYQTEQGQRLPYVPRPRVTLEPIPYSGQSLIVSANSVSAPPGKYILFVQVPGYQDYRAEIVLNGSEVHMVTLRPTRTP
jgi:cell division protein FtsL